jgi:hypothetical protein
MNAESKTIENNELGVVLFVFIRGQIAFFTVSVKQLNKDRAQNRSVPGEIGFVLANGPATLRLSAGCLSLRGNFLERREIPGLEYTVMMRTDALPPILPTNVV